MAARGRRSVLPPDVLIRMDGAEEVLQQLLDSIK
jgi:hypothetical protein